jgi:CRISPR-associated protein Csm4
MKYNLYALRFDTPVHFGQAELGGKLEQNGLEFPADSLFSALCCELAQMQEQTYLNLLCQKVTTGAIAFTDLLPYKKDEEKDDYYFYVPKPVLTITTTNQIVTDLNEARQVSTQRKKMKKLKYIRASRIAEYIDAIKQGQPFIEEQDFAVNSLVERVNCRGDEPLPYFIGAYSFLPQAGMYCVIRYENEEDIVWMETLLQGLGTSGIGGKRSSGYGKFHVDEDASIVEGMDEIGIFSGDDAALYQMLVDEAAPQQMNLSILLPEQNELSVVQAGQYTLRRRSGFITGGSDTKKRNSVYMIRSGSCFSKRLHGDMVMLDTAAGHPTYRYGKSLFAGLHV